jgi:hypothetical protein
VLASALKSLAHTVLAMTATLEIAKIKTDVFSKMFSEEDILRTNKERQEELVACTTAAFYQFSEMVAPLVHDLQTFDICVDACLSDVLKSDSTSSTQETTLVFSLKQEVRCAPTFPTNRRIEPALRMSYSLGVFTDARIHLSTLLLVKAGATPETLFASGPCGYSTSVDPLEITRMLQDAYLDLCANIPGDLNALSPR